MYVILNTSNVLKAAEPLPALWAVVGVFFCSPVDRICSTACHSRVAVEGPWPPDDRLDTHTHPEDSQ